VAQSQQMGLVREALFYQFLREQVTPPFRHL
jgi:hypothetical protein